MTNDLMTSDSILLIGDYSLVVASPDDFLFPVFAPDDALASERSPATTRLRSPRPVSRISAPSESMSTAVPRRVSPKDITSTCLPRIWALSLQASRMGEPPPLRKRVYHASKSQ